MVLALTKEKDRKEDSENEGMSNNCIGMGGGAVQVLMAQCKGIVHIFEITHNTPRMSLRARMNDSGFAD